VQSDAKTRAPSNYAAYGAETGNTGLHFQTTLPFGSEFHGKIVLRVKE